MMCTSINYLLLINEYLNYYFISYEALHWNYLTPPMLANWTKDYLPI